MTTDPHTIVQEIRAEFETLLEFVLGRAQETPATIYDIETGLIQQLLELGRHCVEASLAERSAQYRSPTAVDARGQVLPYHGERGRSYLSVFGRVRFARSYYWQHEQEPEPNQASEGDRTPLGSPEIVSLTTIEMEGTVRKGWYPLDAAVNLPVTGCSDLLREWRAELSTATAYQRVGRILDRVIGQGGSTREIKEMVQADAILVGAYYEQAASKEPSPAASILVVQADGKGVPLIKPAQGEKAPRLGKGEKKGRKKEAIVTAIYTMAPSPRTPEGVIRSLFGGSGLAGGTVQREDERQAARTVKEVPGLEVVGAVPRPCNKQLWATLEGKAAALAFTAKQAQRQEGTHIRERVALTDGSEALQEQVDLAFPNYERVLDFIHAEEYLWRAANALLGESHPQRTSWVMERALRLLQGDTAAVIADLRGLVREPERTASAQEALMKVAGYFERNQGAMAYDRYLARGWPIATGVIEGTCRHLVKDRCELSGMQWTQEGAEALLRLRCVVENGDWQTFQAYRRAQRHEKVYGVSQTGTPGTKAQSLPPLTAATLGPQPCSARLAA